MTGSFLRLETAEASPPPPHPTTGRPTQSDSEHKIWSATFRKQAIQALYNSLTSEKLEM